MRMYFIKIELHNNKIVNIIFEWWETHLIYFLKINNVAI